MLSFLKDPDGGFSKTLFLMVIPALYTLLYKFAVAGDVSDMTNFGLAATAIIGTWVVREYPKKGENNA